MALVPKIRINRASKIVGQQGNSLADGPDPVYLSRDDLMIHILAPMKKIDATALKLLFDPLPLTKDNCLLPTTLEIATFPHPMR